MKILNALLFAALPSLAGAAPAFDIFAIKVGKAETAAHGTLEHAVILVEDGKIVTIGQDLPIEHGIRVIDLESWTAMPGLVNPYTRIGLDSRAGDEFNPQLSSYDELYPANEDYDELLEYGVTTLGLYPAGRAVPGRAVVVRPGPDTPEAMLVARDAYLKIYFRSDARSKKMLRDALSKVDDYVEKEKKAREKYEKDSSGKKSDEKKSDEKKPEEKTASQDGDKKEEKKDEKSKKPFVPPAPDEKVKPFLDVVNGKLNALVSISQASDYLHLLDAIGEHKLGFDLRIPMTREIDVFEVEKQIGERKCRIVMEPQITLTPGTMRMRNLAQEFAAAGSKIVFLPRDDTLQAHKNWLRNVGEIVAQGLPRETALRAMTLEPAELMGVGARLGSLEKNKDANIVFLNGDPFEPETKIMAVMLEGRIVFGEVPQ